METPPGRDGMDRSAGEQADRETGVLPDGSPPGSRRRCLSLGHCIRTHVMMEQTMPNVVTINRPDVVALIEEAARKLTRGNKTEAVALAMRRLIDEDARAGSLFGAHRGSVKVRDGTDLIAPSLDVEPDAQTGREVGR